MTIGQCRFTNAHPGEPVDFFVLDAFIPLISNLIVKFPVFLFWS